MSSPAEPSYSLQEIVSMLAGGGDQGVVISTENLRVLTAEIEESPDIILKAERVGRERYTIQLTLKLTPRRLAKESRYA